MPKNPRRLIGVGVDLVDIDRAKRLVRRHPEGVGRFLIPSEARLWRKARQKALAFALIFAAKEAASKAVGQSLAGPSAFRDFRVGRSGSRITVCWTVPNAAQIQIDLILFTQKNLVGALAYAYGTRLVPLIK